MILMKGLYYINALINTWVVHDYHMLNTRCTALIQDYYTIIPEIALFTNWTLSIYLLSFVHGTIPFQRPKRCVHSGSRFRAGPAGLWAGPPRLYLSGERVQHVHVARIQFHPQPVSLHSLHFKVKKNRLLFFFRSTGAHTHMIYPWVHQFSNVKSRDYQLTTVTVPDVDPSQLPQLGLFSMAAGDFLQVYTIPSKWVWCWVWLPSNRNNVRVWNILVLWPYTHTYTHTLNQHGDTDKWSCIACCFFIDTAHNILDYLERIYTILKPGGIWINFGWCNTHTLT